MLENTPKTVKPRKDTMGVSMGINLSKDTSKLEVCFGGFAPTVMNAGLQVNELVDQAEERAREHKRAREQAAALEASRASEPRLFVDEAGVEWTYVVLDGSAVRIEKCKTDLEALRIPDMIEGMSVAALAADACAYLPNIIELYCPDDLVSVGYCAFRGCKKLVRARLPRKLANYDSSWFRNCGNLKELELPGYVEQLDSSIFDNDSLAKLVIGEGAYAIAPGAFGKSKLEAIEVAEGNPFLKTDGLALYSKDGSAMLALCVPVEKYRVVEGCRYIARKGMSGFDCVKSVEVPKSLEVVDGFAFWRTNISEFSAPATLKQLGEKAFFNCRALEKVSFEEGLVKIGENAFTGTRISELRLPSTIEELGSPLAAGTKLVYAGPEATFGIAGGGVALKLDEFGGLYREGELGPEFVLLLDPDAKSYEVREGIVRICEGAFAGHEKLEEVKLPESIVEIGVGAFKACRSLERVNMPEGVHLIDEEAFLDTNLKSVYLPSGLERLGKNALVTKGAHYSVSMRQARVAPSLREIAVGEGNERFIMQGSLLLERAGTDGSMRVLLCTGSEEVVRIPSEVNEIAPYALNNVKGIRELYLSDRIVLVGIRGLAVDGFVELLHIDLVKMQHGRDYFELRFPDTDRGIQQMMLALSVPDHVNVEVIFEHYDTAITNGSSFDAATEKGLDLYDQAERLLRRLKDPVFLSEVNRQLCERFLTNNVMQVCVALAKHDDRELLDAMLDLGFLNADNIYAVIERIGAVQDATMTNYLLEARRLRFEQSVFDDFDL